MGLETGVTYIEDLDETWPLGSDDPDTLDNHDRNIKTAVKGSLPNLGATAVTATAAELNIMDGVTAFLNESDMASDSATAIASQHSVKAFVEAKVGTLNQKIVEIGDWDMDTDSSVTSVAHGLTYSKIRMVDAVVRNDGDTGIFNLNASGRAGVNTANLTLTRTTGGDYDASGFSTTSYNRGWVVIQYTD